MQTLTWWHQGECLDESSLKGMVSRGDLATGALYLSVPQAYLEYSSEDWDPPSRWDEGIPGLLFDYNVNAQSRQQQQGGTRGVQRQRQRHRRRQPRRLAPARRLAGAGEPSDRQRAIDRQTVGLEPLLRLSGRFRAALAPDVG